MPERRRAYGRLRRPSSWAAGSRRWSSSSLAPHRPGARRRLMIAVSGSSANPAGVDRWFRRLQLFSAAALQPGHGTNDAQKTMGIIAGILVTAGYHRKRFSVPLWVKLAAHARSPSARWLVDGASSRPWDADHKLKPVGGFCAETARRLPSSAPLPRDPCSHDSHHHRRDRRRRRHPAAIGRALGRCRQDCLGLGAHHSDGRHDRRRRLLDREDVRGALTRRAHCCAWRRIRPAQRSCALRGPFW